jgi:hypothetical protein
MKLKAATLTFFVAMAALVSSVLAADDDVPRLDHVFVVMMENHGFSQIINNPNAPFTNQLARTANLATNYFAVGHPSLTNYLEVVGGSNFGVLSDNDPDWHNNHCATNLTTGVPATDVPATPAICPIWGTGTDAATIAVDLTNETQGPPGENNIDGKASIPANPHTIGKTIADQLVETGRSWKSYQESLPPTGADLVTYSDGFFSNLTDFSKIFPVLTPPLSSGDIVKQYAAKHNPFVYFRNVQQGLDPRNSLANSVDFDGPNGLFADLGSGRVPNFSFIVPNQCHDQHGRGNGGAFCNFDPVSDGSQSGLNPALIFEGDVTIQRIFNAIKSSQAWHEGNNAIVLVWDENDYSTAPNINQVVLIVDTNYGTHGVQSSRRYTHYSLLKSIEAGFGLPCLNHACDAGVNTISDLFSRRPGDEQ